MPIGGLSIVKPTATSYRCSLYKIDPKERPTICPDLTPHTRFSSTLSLKPLKNLHIQSQPHLFPLPYSKALPPGNGIPLKSNYTA
jgi:hypothetical protein